MNYLANHENSRFNLVDAVSGMMQCMPPSIHYLQSKDIWISNRDGVRAHNRISDFPLLYVQASPLNLAKALKLLTATNQIVPIDLEVTNFGTTTKTQDHRRFE